ncbi:MAG: hypothetical protein ACK55Z_36865 [bacterium]
MWSFCGGMGGGPGYGGGHENPTAARSPSGSRTPQKRQQKKTTTAPSKHTIKKQGRKQIEKICLSPTFKANSDRQIP